MVEVDNLWVKHNRHFLYDVRAMANYQIVLLYIRIDCV